MAEKSIEDLFFKPIVIRDERGDRLILIYSSNTQILQSITNKGKIQKKVITVLNLIDISNTIDEGFPILENYTIVNNKQFRDSVISSEPEEIEDAVEALTNVVMEDMQELGRQLNEYNNILTNIRLIVKQNKLPEMDSENPDSGNLIFVGDSSPLAHIVFKTIKGDVAKLEKSEIEKMGGVILEVISTHSLDFDPTPDNIKGLKAELEYKIIENLPHSLKAGDININMDAVVKEIIAKNPNQEDESEDSNDLEE